MAQINMATEDWVNAQGFAKEGTVFHYMGSVETLAALEALTGMNVGDVYNVKESGANYVWTGPNGDPSKPHQIGWDKLSETIVVTDSFTENITDTGDDAQKAVKSKAVYTALQGKVDKETGKGLSTNDFTDAFETKLDSMVEIDSVDTAQMSIDASTKKLSITAIDMGIVTGLDDALDEKVDKVAGKQLSTEDFTTAHKTKLEAMVEVDSVDTAQMTIDSNKKLSITAIAQSVVTGLDDSLDAKVDKVEGYGLSKNDLTDARKNKLDAMVEVDSVDSTQMTIDASKKLSITAIAQSVVTGLEDALDSKVDKSEGQGLSDENFTEAHKTKLEGLANIKSVDANTLELNSTTGQLKVSAVSMDIVTGLDEALGGKVDKVTGKQLSTEDFTTALKTKLTNMVEIDSVDTAQMSIDASTKKLSITAIDQTVVTGLDTALNGKVDKETGKGLSTNDFTDAFETKLTNMVEIDSVDSTQLAVSASKELSITAVDKSLVTGLDTALNGKVDKEDGKGLSTEDFSTEEKTKLDAMLRIDEVETDQFIVGNLTHKLSIKAVDMDIVTGLNTALGNITTDITNMCNGTKAFTGIKFAYNSKFYTLAVATNTLGQPTLYLEEIVG